MRRLFVIAALLGALGTTAAALAAGNPPITEKILGPGGALRRLHDRRQQTARRRRRQGDGSPRRELRLALAPSRRGGRGQVRHPDPLRQR